MSDDARARWVRALEFAMVRRTQNEQVSGYSRGGLAARCEIAAEWAENLALAGHAEGRREMAEECHGYREALGCIEAMAHITLATLGGTEGVDARSPVSSRAAVPTAAGAPVCAPHMKWHECPECSEMIAEEIMEAARAAFAHCIAQVKNAGSSSMQWMATEWLNLDRAAIAAIVRRKEGE